MQLEHASFATMQLGKTCWIVNNSRVVEQWKRPAKVMTIRWQGMS